MLQFIFFNYWIDQFNNLFNRFAISKFKIDGFKLFNKREVFRGIYRFNLLIWPLAC